MKFDRQQLRAMSALRMARHWLRDVTPYSSPGHVQKLAQHFLHKCRDNIQTGIDVTAQELMAITWYDVFDFSPDDISGFSQEDEPCLLLHLHDGRALDVLGLFDDLRECTHFTVN